jgi:hypothetical protein
VEIDNKIISYMRDSDNAVSQQELVIPLKKGERKMGFDLKVDSVRENEMGGHSLKNQVGGHPKRVGGEERETAIKMVVKKAPILNTHVFLGEERSGDSHAERYYKRWLFLKKIGIPTLSSMRVVDENRVAMGDMTADGSQFFGKAELINLDLQYYGGVTRPLTDMENKFLALDDEKVKREIGRMIEIAWDRKMVLPEDEEEFTILVHPDGTWQTLVIDLSWLGNIDWEVGKHDYISHEKEKLFSRLDKMKRTLRLIEKKE